MSTLQQIRAAELTYVIIQSTDLSTLETFMIDFGLHTVKKTTTDLWMGAGNQSPYVYHAKIGNVNKFIGAGFKLKNHSDLVSLAERFDNVERIESIQDPGGGSRLRMAMPDGFVIDAVTDQITATPIISFEPQEPLNFLVSKGRLNRSIRLSAGAKPVRRLGHFVLHVSDHNESVKWLSERFGLVPSDFFGTTDNPPNIFGSFLRIDAGTDIVDHHCILVLQSDHVSAHHISFEMTGIDDLMCAHDFLISRGYHLDVGVGRHMLGSQIFDYWKDPSGLRVEHYTDGDVVNHEHQPTVFTGTADETTQWGARPDAKFFE